MTAFQTSLAARRKPRVLLTGEFSAGKTTLLNGLIGSSLLPTRVVSTAMPPVWLIGEGDASFRIDLSGERHEVVSLDDLPVEDTLIYVRSVEAPILAYCDLIDTPGSSDPNIPAECWERVLGFADTLVWCSGATQAWRQSEKSTCRELPRELLADATLLITHSDRMPDEKSANKVLNRVERDAAEFFPSIRLVSCLNEGDIASVQSHIVGVCERLPSLIGGVVEELEAARQPESREVSAGATQQVETRPIDPVWNIFDDLETPPEPEPMEPEAARPAQEEDAHRLFDGLFASGLSYDHIRSTWLSVIDGRDMTRPDEVLDCLEILLDRLAPPCAAGTAVFKRSTNDGEFSPADQHAPTPGGVGRDFRRN